MTHQSAPTFYKTIFLILIMCILLSACIEKQEFNNTEQPDSSITPEITSTSSPTRFSTSLINTPRSTQVILAATKTVESNGILSPTQTKSPTVVPLPIDNDRVLSMLGGNPLIFLISEDNTHFYLLDIVNDVFWNINKPIASDTYNFLSWANNGCEIILSPRFTNQGDVVRVDLHGNLLQNLHSYNNLNGTLGTSALNSVENMLAYSITDGSSPQIYGSFRSFGSLLEVVDLVHGNTYQLSTKYWGVDKHETLSWSSDGEWLAYSERDPNDVIQIIISHPDGSDRRQLTQFTSPGAWIRALRWSPDGNELAFLYITDFNEPQNYLVVVNVINSQVQPHFFEVDGAVININDFWWQSDSTIVADQYGRILWIDTKNDAIVDILDGEKIPEGYISWIRPIEDSTLIGFFSNSIKYFYLYDVNTQKFARFQIDASYPFVEDPISNWILTPANFIGEKNCRP